MSNSLFNQLKSHTTILRGRSEQVKGFATLLSGRVLAGILQTVFLGLIARSLGVSKFGEYAAAASALLIILAVFDLGFRARALRLQAEAQPGSATSAMMLIRTVLAVCIVAITMAIVGLADLSGPLIVATAVYVTGEGVGDLAVDILLGRRERSRATALLLIRRVVVVVPFATGLSTETATFALLAGGLFGVISGIFFTIHNWCRPTGAWTTIRESVAFWKAGFATNFQQSDSLIVNLAAGSMMAGNYGAATRVGAPFFLITSVVMQLIVPDLASTRSGDKQRRMFVRARRAILYYAVLLIIVASAAPVITDVVLGAAFIGAAPIVGLVIASAGLSAISQVYLSWYYVRGIPRWVPAGMLAAVVLGLIVLAIGSAKFGSWGSGAGVLVTNVGILIVLTWGWNERGRSCE